MGLNPRIPWQDIPALAVARSLFFVMPRRAVFKKSGFGTPSRQGTRCKVPSQRVTRMVGRVGFSPTTFRARLPKRSRCDAADPENAKPSLLSGSDGSRAPPPSKDGSVLPMV